MTDLDPVFEQRLADLSDVDWQALSARVRPPTSVQQLREIAGKVIDGDQLEAFVNLADPKKFATENGDIDETRVMGALTGIFGVVTKPGLSHQQSGQFSADLPMPSPGERGAAEAAKRFGGNGPQHAPNRPGAAGAAEAAKRFGKAHQ